MKYNWGSEEDVMNMDMREIKRISLTETPDFQVGDIVTIKSVWIGEDRIYRGEEGKITEVCHNLALNSGGFYYWIKFGDKIGSTEEENLMLIEKGDAKKREKQ